LDEQTHAEDLRGLSGEGARDDRHRAPGAQPGAETLEEGDPNGELRGPITRLKRLMELPERAMARHGRREQPRELVESRKRGLGPHLGRDRR
jgi:hypothetical protein